MDTEVLGRGTGVWGDSASARMHRHTGTAVRDCRGTAASSGMSRTCSSILGRDAAAEPGGSGGCHSRVPRPGEPQLQQPGGDGSGTRRWAGAALIHGAGAGAGLPWESAPAIAPERRDCLSGAAAKTISQRAEQISAGIYQ